MKRVFLISGVVLAALVTGVALVYAFGTPQSAADATVPGSPAGSSTSVATPPVAGEGSPADGSSAVGSPSMDGPGSDVDPQEEAPPPDPNAPLAIEIPGCVCHSDDPAVVERHAQYRMNQCAGCHVGGVPTGQ